MIYKSIEAASKSLLGEYCDFLNQKDIEYIVIGGWSPYLLNSGLIKHPGTHDVDVLFRNAATENYLKSIVEESLMLGYKVSAKHPFQLFRIINVDGQDFVFNIDMLHPNEKNMKGTMFVDQLELSVPIDLVSKKYVKAKSIVGPNSDILFENYILEKFDLNYISSLGEYNTAQVSLINEVGCILSKAQSCSKKKRERDSLDIYLAIKQARNYKKLIDGINRMESISDCEFYTLNDLKKFFNSREMFNNVMYFAPNINQDEFVNVMKQFFKDIRL